MSAIIASAFLAALQWPISWIVKDPFHDRVVHTTVVQIGYEIAIAKSLITRPATPFQFLSVIGTYWAIRAVRSYIQVATSEPANMPVSKTAHDIANKSNSPMWGVALVTGGLIDIAAMLFLLSAALASDGISAGIFAVHVALR